MTPTEGRESRPVRKVMAKEFGTTLYYPYIHPREAGHLKAALMYWDRVRRIVPDSVTHGRRVMDDDADCQLLADSGLLLPTRPQQYEDAAAQRFFAHLEPKSTAFRVTPGLARQFAAENRGIHIEKIGWSALGKLQNLGLAHRFGDWVAMRDEVGAFYMFCLASEMSQRMSAPLMTDSSRGAKIGEALLFEPDGKCSSSETLVELGLSLPSPAELEHVPTRDIVKFSNTRAAERGQFRAAVEGILNVAREIEDPNAIDDYLSQQRVQMRSAVTNLRKCIDEIHAGTVGAAARITVPAGASAAIAILPISKTAAAILAAAGLTVGAISCYAETRGKLRTARTASPYHYLLSVSRRFGRRREEPPSRGGTAVTVRRRSKY